MISAATQQAIKAALRDQDFNRAGMLAEAALAGGESHSLIYGLAAFRRQQAGDSRRAAEYYLHAARLAPNDPVILASAGDALRYTGQLRQSVALFDRALAGDPMMVGAWYGRALALDASGAIEDARKSYLRVAELAPSSAAGFAGLASMHCELGEIDEACANVERARVLGPNESTTILALASCDIARGLHRQATEKLQVMLRHATIAPIDAVRALKLLGDALDRQGRFDEAYDAYASANERFAEIHAGPNAPPVSHEVVETIDEAVAGLSPGSLAGLAPQDSSQAKGHIFLLGYPRSGTTLTEQILATCPRVVTLEEGPTLSDAEQYLTADGIAALAVMSDEEAARLRTAYWKRVAAAGVDVTDQTFIDMDPFKGPALPLIARLFPAAKVIVMRRDPRDVVWSCFRHSFVYSPVVYEFTSLARAARHYSATMQLIHRCLETLPLTAHTVYYEDLVDDFDATTRRVCSFAGLPWSPALRDFAATARVRSVKTASAPQVRTQLFDGSGQWRNYANKLEPMLPMLSRWQRPDDPNELISAGKRASAR